MVEFTVGDIAIARRLSGSSTTEFNGLVGRIIRSSPTTYGERAVVSWQPLSPQKKIQYRWGRNYLRVYADQLDKI